MDEFLIMDRTHHGRNRTIDRDYHFEVDDSAMTSGRIFDRPLHERIRTPDDKNYHLMDGGGRVDGRTDETDGRMTHQFRIYAITISVKTIFN